MSRDFTKEELDLVDEYRKLMEATTDPKKRAALAKELGDKLDLPLPKDFPS